MERNVIFPCSPTLPRELVEEILVRFPVRCLLRFKCVCKSWFSLISDPKFAKSHFDLTVGPTERVLLSFSKNSEATSIEIEAPLLDNGCRVVVAPSPIYKYEHIVDEHIVDVVGSCRGFLLLVTESSSDDDFIYFLIWNPSTGFQKRFNKVLNLPRLFGIGYDSSVDDYVVVTSTIRCLGPLSMMIEFHCFSTTTNSLTCTEVNFPCPPLGRTCNHGSFLNGVLHWLVFTHDNDPRIIAFNVMERSIAEISQPPREFKYPPYLCHFLRVMGGCLCLCVETYETGLTEIWKMNEYKVQPSWTKLFVFYTDIDPFYHFIPICFTENGEILGHDHGCADLARINDKGELLEHQALGMLTRRYGLLCSSLYTESLLSLPVD